VRADHRAGRGRVEGIADRSVQRRRCSPGMEPAWSRARTTALGEGLADPFQALASPVRAGDPIGILSETVFDFRTIRAPSGALRCPERGRWPSGQVECHGCARGLERNLRLEPCLAAAREERKLRFPVPIAIEPTHCSHREGMVWVHHQGADRADDSIEVDWSWPCLAVPRGGLASAHLVPGALVSSVHPSHRER
jgi:hypothetical protein